LAEPLCGVEISRLTAQSKVRKRSL